MSQSSQRRSRCPWEGRKRLLGVSSTGMEPQKLLEGDYCRGRGWGGAALGARHPESHHRQLWVLSSSSDELCTPNGTWVLPLPFRGFPVPFHFSSVALVAALWEAQEMERLFLAAARRAQPKANSITAGCTQAAQNQRRKLFPVTNALKASTVQ